MVNISDYQDLAETGVLAGKKQVPAEEEEFKALYIAGQARQDETSGETTTPGLLQIRGLKTNLREVHMILTHIKTILVNEKSDTHNPQQRKMVCCSYQSGPKPWKGSSGRVCGQTRADRSADDFCKTCRQQIVAAGIYCDNTGKPIVNKGGKPEFIFVRGKGIKYSNVSSYVQELSELELDSFFGMDDDETKKFEKTVVNHKRFITKITPGSTKTDFGDKSVFNFERSTQLDNKTVEKILNISKRMLNQFNEKFDWTKGQQTQSVSGYGENTQDVNSNQQFEDPKQDQDNVKQNKEKKEETNSSISFDDFEF